MEKINREKITKFLMKYWWIWLVLLVISSLFLIFGARDISLFLYSVFWHVFAIALVFLLYRYTFGNAKTKTWGIFRLIGILGTLFSSWGLVEVFKISGSTLSEGLNHPYFKIASIGLILSLLFFSIGEIINYLDHIHNTNIKIMANYSFDKEQENQKMICPRCLGKGFVDLNDIKRLGKETRWEQGACPYCGGQGNVKRGKTIEKDPRDSIDVFEVLFNQNPVS
jgi:hypothetical protein